ncbi:MAG: hypothetical protein Q8M32_03030 [Brevundimonas sp.]|nr:hypothetical protein [Brevundimonas sp.]
MQRQSFVRYLCLILAGMSFLAGMARLAEVGLVATNPLWIVTDLNCHNGTCAWVSDPSQLAGSIDHASGASGRTAEEAVLTHMAKAPVHRLLIAAELLRALPLAALYGALAFALIRLGEPEAVNRGAIRWLRRASVAAAALIFAKPLAESLQATALSGSDGFRFAIVGSDLPFDLLLVGIVWVVAWALEQGTRAHDELAEYV